MKLEEYINILKNFRENISVKIFDVTSEDLDRLYEKEKKLSEFLENQKQLRPEWFINKKTITLGSPFNIKFDKYDIDKITTEFNPASDEFSFTVELFVGESYTSSHKEIYDDLMNQLYKGEE